LEIQLAAPSPAEENVTHHSKTTRHLVRNGYLFHTRYYSWTVWGDVSSLRQHIDNRFSVLNLAGKGSMGQVFMVSRTRDTAESVPSVNGDILAVKVLDNVTLRQRFIDEYSRLRALGHPAFITAHELGLDTERGDLYSVLEWADGRPLTPDQALDRLSLEAAAAAMLRGIDHLHRHGIVHGDIAPQNLLWTGRDDVPIKLLDLGAGGPIGSGGGRTSGVLTYAAPERLEARPLSIQSDLWSIGAVLFGLVHGCHPFPHYPRQSNVGEGPLRDGLTKDPLDPWLDRLLAEHPEDRYPTAQSALEALGELLGYDVSALSVTELSAGTTTPPFVDVNACAERLTHELSLSADLSRAHAITLGGETGTGRSRLLDELAARLCARGHRVFKEQVLPNDAPGACLVRLHALMVPDATTALGAHEPPIALARALLAETQRREQPTIVLLDDMDRGGPDLQRAIAYIRDTITRQPERVGPLLWVTIEDTSKAEVQLTPWTTETVETLLEGLYPQRRIGHRVAGPLTAASRGLTSRLMPMLHNLIRSGSLSVNAAALQLDNDFDATDEHGVEAAAKRLDGLGDDARLEGALLAYARGPLPIGVIKAAPRMELDRAGFTVMSGRGEAATISLRSAETAEAARAHLDQLAAAEHLAERFARRAATHAEAADEALAYQVMAGQESAIRVARELLVSDTTSHAASLVALLVSDEWPNDAGTMVAVADAYRAEGNADEASRHYNQASQGNGASATHALRHLGELEAHRSRHAQAIQAFERALTLDDDGSEAAIYAGLAHSAMSTGRLEDAAQWCTRGLELTERERQMTWARLKRTAGLIAWYRGDLADAQGHLEQSWEFMRAVDDLVEGAAVVTALGLVAHRREDLDGAETHYRDALLMGEKANDPSRILTALQNLAVVQHQRGAFAEALATYEEAAAMAKGLAQVGREVQLAGNLGNLWRYLGQRDDAERVLKAGLEQAQTTGDQFMEGSLLLILGEVALDFADWERAEIALVRALEVAELNQSASEQGESLLALTSLRIEQGRRSDALVFGKRALDTAKRTEREALTSQAHARLAEAYAMDDQDEDQAQHHAAAARATVDAISNPDHRWSIHRVAYQAAKRRADEAVMASEAAEVKRLLQRIFDGVPALYREAFQSQRERHRAWLEAENMTVTPLRLPIDSSRSRERWTRLLEVSRRMATEHDPKRLLEYIMDSAILLCGAERGFLLLVEENDAADMPIRVARNIDQENIRNTRFKISRSIARRVIESGDPLLTIDAMEDDRYREQLSVHDLKLRSVLCLPMTVRGRVIGAIYMDNRFQVSAFDDDDSIQMQAFAGQAAVALDTARLLESMESTQQELRHSREEVEALNVRLREQLDKRTLELEATHRVVVQQRQQLEANHQYDKIIGSSDAIGRVFQIMDRLLDNTIPVLIEGESGTGKELVARAIHFNGPRRDKPFIALNCGAIPANLLESELFGHVRGAFTGATADKPGLFEAAHGGTLLLDELGELPLEMQVKLLRVLQSGEIQKVGDTKERHVDVRIVAATNRRMNEEVAAGRFREDLFYRLAVIPVRLPPLRERRDDIPALIQHFLTANREAGVGSVDAVSSRTLSLLTRYAWPGNVRQLEMVLKNASLFADHTTLEPDDLSSFPDITGVNTARLTGAGLSGRSLAEIEREAIMQTLQDTNGNKKRAAEQLGIDRRTLYNKLAAYKIIVEKKLKVR
jgi:serine/threonine-protein kinase PknK